MAKVYSEAELKDMKLANLKAICKDLKLKPTGPKAELINRILGIFLTTGGVSPNSNSLDSSPFQVDVFSYPQSTQNNFGNNNSNNNNSSQSNPKKRKKKASEELESPPSSPTSNSVMKLPETQYPEGYLEFMRQMTKENMTTILRLGIPVKHQTVLDLAQVEWMVNGKSLVSKSSLVTLSQSKSELRAIFILSSVFLDDNTLEEILKNAPQLQFLSVRECNLLTDNSLKSLSKCKNLLGLELSHLSSITNEGVSGLIKQLPRLRHLNVACSNNLGDLSFENISTTCPTLQIVDGLGGENYTEKTIEELTKIRKLLMVDCSNPNFGPECLRKLKQTHNNVFMKGTQSRVAAP
eukprot:TRINITY_DN1173_c0_g1_i1.p1 TRINITY_DN1173_c0_g1~~TRINITY_DN1173_c0_g1_i1.p1  ORF type:complete len:351 (+),score=113.95 TRINITY_DN1173_c0_g1_i1:291-1343(+)